MQKKLNNSKKKLTKLYSARFKFFVCFYRVGKHARTGKQETAPRQRLNFNPTQPSPRPFTLFTLKATHTLFTMRTHETNYYIELKNHFKGRLIYCKGNGRLFGF